MNIIKASGDIEKFDPKKIYFTIKEAGASDELAKEAVKSVRSIYHEGLTTNEVLKFLLKFLQKEEGVSQRYNLKKAVMALGPFGFPFEKFFARLLDYYGYQTETDLHLKGKRIYHEVDVVATKKKKAMIECKFHNKIGTSTDLHPAMYTYARFLDLKNYNFDYPWLVTNTKCSNDAVEYAKGVALKVTSWNYPPKESLLRLIENKRIYPITIANSIKNYERELFYKANIIVANDLLDKNSKWIFEQTGIPELRAQKILNEIKQILKI